MISYMSNTNSIPPGLWKRIATTLALFTGVLLVGLLVSRLFIIPLFTHVELAGSTYDVSSLRNYYNELSQEVAKKEAERNSLIFPVQMEEYVALRDAKHDQLNFSELRSAVENAAQQFESEGKAAVAFSSWKYDADANSLIVGGMVRNVGSRSMTVLAQFAEALQELPFASSVSQPQYTRLDDSRFGPYSPFNFEITLQ